VEPVKLNTVAIASVSPLYFLRIMHFVQFADRLDGYTMLIVWTRPTFPCQKVGLTDAPFALNGVGTSRSRADVG